MSIMVKVRLFGVIFLLFAHSGARKAPYRLTANGLFEEAVYYLLLSLSLGKT